MSSTKPIKMQTWEVSTGKDGRAISDFTYHSGYFEVEVSADRFYPERLRDQHFAIKLNSGNTGYIFEECEKELMTNLRRIINPIAMVVHRFPHKCFPCRSGEFGFDLERGDWTAPFGTGKVADITFTYNLVVTNDMSRCSGSLSFNASGGVYKLKRQKGTSFVSVYEADSNATYSAEFTYSSYCNDKDNRDYASVRGATAIYFNPTPNDANLEEKR
jgi:hypothetical protein